MNQDARSRIPVEDPLSRSARSWWLVLVSAVMFLVWAGSFFLAAEDKVFLGTPLSSDHESLKKDCDACHRPGRGVPSGYCASDECHHRTIDRNLHESLPDKCYSCHPEHWRGQPLPKPMTDRKCMDCHEPIWKEKGRPEESMVGREIFSHTPHRKNYDCRTCHGKGDDTLNVPRERLFRMDTCNICHVETQCMLCHSYHDKKTPPEPRDIGSITADHEEEIPGRPSPGESGTTD